MTVRRWVFRSLALTVVGLGVAAIWIMVFGGRTLVEGLGRVRASHFGALLAITASWHAVRFVRWQFLLRRSGIRLPVRRTLSIFLAGITGTATPAYAGEIVRSLLVRRSFGVPVRATAWVLVTERVLDVIALAILAVAGALGGKGQAWAVVALTGAILLAGLTFAAARAWGAPDPLVRALMRPRVALVSVALSLAAWAPASLMPWVAASGLGETLGIRDAARAFALSTLAGGLSLAPAGIGVTGTAAILQLRASGLAWLPALTVVSLVRLAGTGASLAVGSALLLRELRRRGTFTAPDSVEHFDELAGTYACEFPPHVWARLLTRRIGIVAEAVGPPEHLSAPGLDIGCGLGLQAVEMGRRGYRIVGVDPSLGLLRSARGAGVIVSAGDARRLPLRDGSVSFAYAIGSLHHVGDLAAQRQAILDVARVLQPGGILVVHETNPRNALFRFYMGYVFPVVRRVDEGTEWWIDPRRWAEIPGLTRVEIRYFTFLPDFLPRALETPALAVERLLERTFLSRWSAHYAAVMRRTCD